MEELARKSQELAEQQRNFESRMRQTFAGAGDDQGRPTLMQPGISRKQVEQLGAEQKKLIEGLTQLEQDMQKAARDMAGSQRSASGKVRDALGDVQKQELRLKMGWTVEVMRRGMGAYALTRQPEITRGLNQLRDRLHDAQSAMNHDPDGGQDLEAALGRVEQLRQRLEELKSGGQERGAKGQPGSQGKKGGAPGQQGSGKRDPDRGEGRGQKGSQGQNGEASASSREALRRGRTALRVKAGPGAGSSPNVASGRGGQFDPHGSLGRGLDPGTAGRAIREGIRDLGQLEQMLRSNREIPHEVTRDVQDLIREMRQVRCRQVVAVLHRSGSIRSSAPWSTARSRSNCSCAASPAKKIPVVFAVASRSQPRLDMPTQSPSTSGGSPGKNEYRLSLALRAS